MDAAALSPDGRTLVASSRTGKKLGQLLLWDLDNQSVPPTSLPGPTDSYFFALSFSPDGRAFAAGNDDGVVLLWDLERPADPPVVLAEQEAGVRSLAFSPDGRRIAVVTTQDDTVWSLDLADPDAGIIFGPAEKPADEIVPFETREGIPVAFSRTERHLPRAAMRGV